MRAWSLILTSWGGCFWCNFNHCLSSHFCTIVLLGGLNKFVHVTLRLYVIPCERKWHVGILIMMPRRQGTWLSLKKKTRVELEVGKVWLLCTAVYKIADLQKSLWMLLNQIFNTSNINGSLSWRMWQVRKSKAVLHLNRKTVSIFPGMCFPSDQCHTQKG